MKKKIIRELENRFFGPYVLNSIVEPISIGSITLQPVLVVKLTHAGYYIENCRFNDQYIEEIEEFEWEKEEDNIYMEIEFKNGLLSMTVQEEYDNDVQWIEVKFIIIEKE